ncbi:MAG: hypothetical protein CME60_10750 [Halobacteriovoraceae bacterium]|nr:hypothetical protein [Halobacteriovoraceae bacterium]
MRLFKFSFIALSFFTLTSSFAFTTNECLRKDFDLQVSHKGFPFGLLEVKLGLKKEGCNLTIDHQELKYLNSAWQVDVCRGPVHIKKGAGAVEVIKKVNNCTQASKDDFCLEFKELTTLIQDDGLIFASGVKENISSDHGQVYCGFLLLKKYLDESLVFSGSSDYDDRLETLKGSKIKDRTSADSDQRSIAPRPVMDDSPLEVSDSEDEESDLDERGEGSF